MNRRPRRARVERGSAASRAAVALYAMPPRSDRGAFDLARFQLVEQLQRARLRRRALFGEPTRHRSSLAQKLDL